MTAPEYDLRPLDLSTEGLAKVTALLRLVFPHAAHYSEALLRWQYVDNPDGPAVGYNAWADKELAAHYVTIPMRAQVDGREERGLLSLNTATAPTHQGKGLFTRLAEATYRTGAEQGFGFVVGVANANSTHGFTKKLGFQLVSPLRAMVGIGSLPLRPDDGNVQFAPMHSEAKLRWRTAHPAHTYTLAAEPGKWSILSPKKMKGARFLLAAGLGDAPHLLLQKENPPALKAWIGLDPLMAWTTSAYLNVPMRLRPSPLNMIFKDLSGAGRKLNASKVRMEAIDFDVL
ncbi:MAG: GNAT family N-acetyltransferase [Flavobacteriales bacterium]|nr:GNAT family N-acetyltransferase [Flavobacteriales bacterium]MBP6698648.1 GNAT family N-acetyltransferase [Flavobacteriales bacterium]